MVNQSGGFCTVDEALEALRRGEMIIVVDDEKRENEGDLLMAAEKASPEAVNFMAAKGRGLICLSLTAEQVKRLGLKMMTDVNESSHETAFTETIEARHGVTTGISAFDRSKTIRTAINPKASPADIVKPGHVFPLKAKEGGVLERAGHTEAAVDLMRMAGMNPSGVICEIMEEDGHMMRLPGLRTFARKHGLLLLTIADLIEYRLDHEPFIVRKATADMPTEYGKFTLYGYENRLDRKEHIALVKGDVSDGGPVLVRVHSECLTGDALGSLKCECGDQLHRSMELIEREGRGIIVYLRQEGRGIGLINKIHAYHLQEKGMDTVEANVALGFPSDLKEYGIGAQILHDLGVKKIRLLTNNPKKMVAISGYGMEVVERVPIYGKISEYNRKYLQTKKEKMGHLIDEI